MAAATLTSRPQRTAWESARQALCGQLDEHIESVVEEHSTAGARQLILTIDASELPEYKGKDQLGRATRVLRRLAFEGCAVKVPSVTLAFAVAKKAAKSGRAGGKTKEGSVTTNTVREFGHRLHVIAKLTGTKLVHVFWKTAAAELWPADWTGTTSDKRVDGRNWIFRTGWDLEHGKHRPRFPTRWIWAGANGVDSASVADGTLPAEQRPLFVDDDHTPALPVPPKGTCFRDAVVQFNCWAAQTRTAEDPVRITDFYRFVRQLRHCFAIVPFLAHFSAPTTPTCMCCTWWCLPHLFRSTRDAGHSICSTVRCLGCSC